METDKKTNYRYIHYGDIHTGTARKITNESKLPMIKSGNYIPLQKGDIVFADASEDYKGIAEPSVILEKLPYHVVAGLHTIAIRPNNYDPLFMYYLFTHKNFRKHGYRVGTGMKVFGISEKNLLKFNYFYPKYEEQLFIKKLLDSLDNLITLYQRKKDCLDQLYKGLLEYLTENYDEMSTFRIGELFEERDERTSNRELLSVTISSGVVPFNTINKIDNSSDDKSRYKCVEKNDIVYNSMRMWQGASGLSNYTGIVSPAYTVLKPRENVNSAYISKVFKKRTIINFFTRFSQGLTSDTWNLKYNQIKDINISLPSNNAQKEIISVLSSIEKIKKEVNHKSNTFNKLKKSYLDKLFL